MTDTREALLDAGQALIAERGYAGVSVGQIEEAAGFVARGGTLYRHFDSKADLLRAAVQRHIDSLDEQDGLAAMIPLPDLRSELHVIGQWTLRRLDAEESISRVIEKEGGRLGSLVDAMREGISETGYQLFATYLEDKGLEPGVDGLAAAVMLIGALVNLRRSAWTFGTPPAGISDEDALRTWVGLCLAVLARPETV